MAFTLSGFLVGCLVGISGVGGGALMTPILVLIFGIHPVTAVGTDLLYAAITKSFGTLMHNRSRAVDWRITGLMALGSGPVTAVMFVILTRIESKNATFSHVINISLSAVLFITSIVIIVRPILFGLILKRGLSGMRLSTKLRALLTVMVGAVLGLLVSLTSVGAGAIGVTALVTLYPHMSTHRIVASDIAHAVPLTFIGGLGYLYLGEINFRILLSLLVGSIPGIIFGSLLSTKVPDRLLRPFLAFVLSIIAFRMAII